MLVRFFIRSRLCCGSPSHTGTFGLGRGRSLEGDFLALARFFIRSRLCCGSPSHTGTFGLGRGRSLEGDFLALYFILALSIICLPGVLRPAGTRRQPSSFIRAWDRRGNVLDSTPQAEFADYITKWTSLLIAEVACLGVISCKYVNYCKGKRNCFKLVGPDRNRRNEL